MYLKELEIKGFKSFADYTKLTFSTEISAIVGPNGSGKSNIIDAIRWVLGEQSSKSLRSKRMDDVIFSGADHRSAMGFSEVGLLLGREEAQGGDLFIARRLFKNGDSDYKINQKKVKLKDIHNLFMDTGVGKNGYSIISQGGIDNVVNASPADLREIVEEAVGIVAYKSKKIEAEKRLKKANDHLERINDIRLEVERQYKPLKRQAEKAKIYLNLREKLKVADLFYYYQEILKINEETTILKKDLKDVETQIYNHKIEYETQDKNYLINKAQIKNLETKKEAQEQTRNECLKKLAQTREQISELEKKKNIEENNINHSEKLITQLLEEKNNLLPLIEINKKEKDACLLQRCEQTKQIESLQKNKHDTQNTLEQLRSHQSNIQEMFNDEQKVIETLQTQVIQKKSEIKHFSESLSQLEEDIRETFEKIVALTKNYEEWHNRYFQIHNVYRESELRRISIENLIKYYGNVLNKLKDSITNLENRENVAQSKHQYLLNLQENYKDYFFAVQKIMESRQSAALENAVLYGPLSDLITTKIQYAKAINAVMGARSNHVVVKDLQSTHKCINLLKDMKWGRVTFLPLSNIQAYPIDENTLNTCRTYKGFIGLAKDLIQYEDLYTAVIDMVFGRVLVADNFKNAQSIFNGFYRKYMVVTIEGEIFYPNGSIVGGESKKNLDTPFMRRQETKVLKEKIDALRKEKLKGQSKLSEIKNRYDWYVKKSKIAEKMTGTLRQKRQIIIKELQNLIYEAKAEDIRFTDYSTKIQTLLKSKNEENRKLKKIIKQLKTHESNKPKPETVDLQVNKTIKTLQTIEKSLQEKQMEILQIDKEMAITTERLSHHVNRLESIEKQFIKTNNELKDAKRNFKINVDILNQRLDEKKKLLEQEKAVDYTYREMMRSIRALKEINDTTEITIKEKNRIILSLTETENTLKLQINNLKNKLEYIEEAAYKNYGYNLIMIEDYYRQFQTTSIIEKTEQEKLRKSIEKLGNVNVNAIEEFKALDERYQFITKQYDDLILSRESVLKIIDDLNTSIKTQFAEKFEILQAIFTRTFKTLFEGGYAEINYETPEDILNSGVHIIAKPPGKKLTHLNLLSGGEKSMLAISLLFSFIELNPSPFCIIDEIDASLDDNNIDRFTDYLLQFSQEIQFLLITHRRNTLEVCKKIYGVSMAQNGISQVISLDLEEYMKNKGDENGIAI